MTDLIPGRTSGKFWGTRQSVVTEVSLGGLWLAGHLLDSYDGRQASASLAGFALVFALAAVFGLLDIVVHLGVPEPARGAVQEGSPAWRRMLAPLRRDAFRRLTLAIGVWSFGFAMVGTFGIVYNISLMTTGATRRDRAGAARKLGGTRTRLAVPDLVAKLEDPSLDLQEEAVEALGAIGSLEAVDALLQRLRDPSTLIAPQLCRALRQAADPRAVDGLICQLTSPDREVVIESVRALGAIGERRAIPGILDLMKETRDRKLLAVSSEALAALGELSAAYQIIPQVRETESRTLKQALSLALGDLLGEREVFYQLLILDRESHGAGAAKALRRLGRRVKKHFPRAVRQIASIEELEAAYELGDVERSSGLLLHLGRT